MTEDNRSPDPNGILQHTLPVFQQNWWVGIARGSDTFQDVQVERDGHIVGSLPYITKRTATRIRWGCAPNWTHLGGPVLAPSLAIDEKIEVLRQLIGQLPRRISFTFQCPAHSPDAPLLRQVFQEAGFIHTKSRTYTQRPDQLGIFFEEAVAVDELGLHRESVKSSKKSYKKNTDRVDQHQAAIPSEPTKPRGEAERKLQRNVNRTRTYIRSAQTRLDVLTLSPVEFVQFYQENLQAKGQQNYSSLPVALRLIEEGIKRGQVRIFAARKKSLEDVQEAHRLDAAIACACDHERSYLWMTTLREDIPSDKAARPDPGAMKLLLAHALKDAQKRGLTFDADGVSVGQTETLYRDRMHIPNLEEQDVFTRLTKTATVVDFIKPSVKECARIVYCKANNLLGHVRGACQRLLASCVLAP